MTSHLIFIWLSEFLTTRHRGLFTITGISFIALNSVWISLYFRFVGVWQYWYLANSGEVLLSFFLVWLLVPESPRSLIHLRKFDQARLVLARMARVNKRTRFEGRFKEEESEESLPHGEQSPQAKPRCLDLFSQSRRRVLLLFVVPCLWMAGDVANYGIQYGLSHLNGSIYTNGLLLGVADFLAQILSGLLSNFWGRKPTILLFWALAAAGCLSYESVGSSRVASYVCVWLGRMGSNGAFFLMFLITSESFPTAHRGTMYAVSNTFARVGGILARMVPSIVGEFMYFEGGVAVAGFLLSLGLIETKNLKMEETVEREKGT